MPMDNILEAEGNLNREIQSALSDFRAQLLQNIQPNPKMDLLLKPYETSKEGPEKKFHFRESLLSIMFEIKDFRTIYNMTVASFIILTLSLLYDSYMISGEVLDVMSLSKIFRGSKSVLIVWLVQVSIFFLIIPLTKIALRTRFFIWLPLYLGQLSLIMWIGIRASNH